MKNILVVSTDQSLLENMSHVLSSFDFTVNTSQNADEFFEQLKTNEPDLMIIDFILNDVNGGTLSRQIKSDAAHQHQPILILTDYPELQRFSNKFGCDAMLNKPFRMHELVNTVLTLTLKSGSYLNRAS